MTATRIYKVTAHHEHRLVEAQSAAQAIRHVVKSQYSAKAATPKDVAIAMSAGVRIETASNDGIEANKATTHTTNNVHTN